MNSGSPALEVAGSDAFPDPSRQPSVNCSEPKVTKISMMPIENPQSPMRFTTNAFFAASPALLLVEVVADQQIRTQTHAFPSDEHHHVVVAQDQREHREHEEVQVGEEPVEAVLFVHVTRWNRRESGNRCR